MVSHLNWVLEGSETDPCCCCGVGAYGETITLTISGVLNCGCVSGIEFTSVTLPSVWVMTWNGTFWIAPNAGTASRGLCGNPPDETASFNASAICAGEELVAAVAWQGSVVTNAYQASFLSPSSSRSNTLICGDPGVFFGGGNGSI